MAFHQRSVRSRVVKDSVWDQTLIIGNVGLFGSTYPNVLESPPHITIEFFKKVCKLLFLFMIHLTPLLCMYTCQHALVNMHLSTCTCQHTLVNMHLSTCTCQHAPVNIHLSTYTCQHTLVNIHLCNIQLSTYTCQHRLVNMTHMHSLILTYICA